MPLLEGGHHHHLGMQIASKVRKEDRVATLLEDLSLRVNEYRAHTIVPHSRRHQGLRTRENPKALISVMCALR
jgi:hypothetical protein